MRLRRKNGLLIKKRVFYFLEGVTVASYADDTTPYSTDKTNDLVIKAIEHFSEVLFKWFGFNYTKIHNASHILFSGNNNVSAIIDDNTIISENKNELLSIILDHIRSHKQPL